VARLELWLLEGLDGAGALVGGTLEEGDLVAGRGQRLLYLITTRKQGGRLGLYPYIHIYICTHTHTYVRIYTHTHIYIYTYTHIYIYVLYIYITTRNKEHVSVYTEL